MHILNLQNLSKRRARCGHRLEVLNADGSPASLCETELTLICITGIEDPLREQAQFCCASALGRVKDEK